VSDPIAWFLANGGSNWIIAILAIGFGFAFQWSIEPCGRKPYYPYDKY
jgi:hypothetical protein